MPGGSNVDDGSIYSQPCSAGALNDDFVPAIYVGQYASLMLNIVGGYTGVLSPQGTNDPGDPSSWRPLQMTDMASLDAGDTVAGVFASVSNRAFGCLRTYLYFRCRMTTYFSGVAEGTFQVFKNGFPGLQLQYTYARSQFGHVVKNSSGIVLPSGLVTSDGHFDFTNNYSTKGLKLYIIPGTFGSGASNIIITIQDLDLESGQTFDMLTSSALADSTPATLKIHPGLTAIANQVSNDFMPIACRVKWSASNWGAGGSTLGINYAVNG